MADWKERFIDKGNGTVQDADADLLWAKKDSRQECLKTLERCLDEFIIDPIKTTVPFYQKIISNAKFVAGDYNTTFLNKFLDERKEE